MDVEGRRSASIYHFLAPLCMHMILTIVSAKDHTHPLTLFNSRSTFFGPDIGIPSTALWGVDGEESFAYELDGEERRRLNTCGCAQSQFLWSCAVGQTLLDCMTCIDVNAGTCNHAGISAHTSQLQGPIPTEIGLCGCMTFINVFNNQLTGTIPSEIGNMADLAQLYLGANFLHGSIPSEIGRLTSLTTFILIENFGMTGTLPSELGDCTMMDMMVIRSSTINGTIPNELSKLTELSHLGMSYNDLSGAIPSFLFHLEKLTALHIEANDFNGTFPSLNTATMSTSLENLTFGMNRRLTGTIPTELGALTNMWSLAFNEADLHGPIPVEIGELSNLGRFNVRGNTDLTGSIPDILWDRPLLKFDVSECSLNGTIPSDMTEIGYKRWYVSGNRFTGTIPSEIGMMDDVVSLWLNDNGLWGQIPTEMGTMVSLQDLHLSHNDLTGPIPVELGKLIVLRFLRLDHNLLTGNVPSELGILSDLGEPISGASYGMKIGHNLLIGEIPSSLTNLEQLRDLYVENMRMNGTMPGAIGKLSLLESLVLSTNELNGPIPDIITTLSKLVLLKLNTNHLTGTIPSDLSKLTHLQELTLSRNDLHGAIPILTGCESLRLVLLQYNRLTRLPSNALFGLDTSHRNFFVNIGFQSFVKGDTFELEQQAFRGIVDANRITIKGSHVRVIPSFLFGNANTSTWATGLLDLSTLDIHIIEDHAFFVNEKCLSRCTNTDGNAENLLYDNCDVYDLHRDWCTNYLGAWSDVLMLDDDDFLGNRMCCACGAGSVTEECYSGQDTRIDLSRNFIRSISPSAFDGMGRSYNNVDNAVDLGNACVDIPNWSVTLSWDTFNNECPDAFPECTAHVGCDTIGLLGDDCSSNACTGLFLTSKGAGDKSALDACCSYGGGYRRGSFYLRLETSSPVTCRAATYAERLINITSNGIVCTCDEGTDRYDVSVSSCRPACNAGEMWIDHTEDDDLTTGIVSSSFGVCRECETGRASASGAWADMCEACGVGQFSASTGSTKCVPCEENTFADIGGRSECDICPFGTKADVGASACVQCDFVYGLSKRCETPVVGFLLSASTLLVVMVVIALAYRYRRKQKSNQRKAMSTIRSERRKSGQLSRLHMSQFLSTWQVVQRKCAYALSVSKNKETRLVFGELQTSFTADDDQDNSVGSISWHHSYLTCRLNSELNKHDVMTKSTRAASGTSVDNEEIVREMRRLSLHTSMQVFLDAYVDVDDENDQTNVVHVYLASHGSVPLQRVLFHVSAKGVSKRRKLSDVAPLKSRIHWMKDVASAIAWLHTNDFVHANLQLCSVFVEYDHDADVTGADSTSGSHVLLSDPWYAALCTVRPDWSSSRDRVNVARHHITRTVNRADAKPLVNWAPPEWREYVTRHNDDQNSSDVWRSDDETLISSSVDIFAIGMIIDTLTKRTHTFRQKTSSSLSDGMLRYVTSRTGTSDIERSLARLSAKCVRVDVSTRPTAQCVERRLGMIFNKIEANITRRRSKELASRAVVQPTSSIVPRS